MAANSLFPPAPHKNGTKDTDRNDAFDLAYVPKIHHEKQLDLTL